MRPTTSTMLQQNNNNNYPCLNMSGSTQDMLQKCSRDALPFPSRLELGDLPLIRGLRAWALCSKNRRKAGGLLGSRPAPAAPHAGRGSPTSCSKPAGVYLQGRTRYGLPLGLDARQAEIGALVTVATLKTSEGSGKTQTQCVFLQTEKGSCLYSTAKPGCGGSTGAGSSVVGGWLRGKTGGSRDTSAGRRDIGPNPPARVRAGSGRRWRKSANAAGCEKAGASRERRQRSREVPGEAALEERKEAQDKGALDYKQFPSPQQHKREGVCRPPRGFHNASPKTSAQCRRRAQRRGSQEEHGGGESPSTGKKGARKERQKEEEEEEEAGVCELGSSSLVLAAPNPDLESNPEEPSGCQAEEIREAEGTEEPKGRNTPRKKEPDAVTTHHGPSETSGDASKFKRDKASSDGKPVENNVVATEKRFSDGVEANRGLEKEMQSTDVGEETQSIAQTPAVSVSNCPDLISAASVPESSAPLEGSVCAAALGSHWEKQLDGQRVAEEDRVLRRGQQLDISHETNTVKANGNGDAQVFFLKEENEASASPHFGNFGKVESSQKCQRAELVSNPETWKEAGETWRREHELNVSAEQEESDEEKTNCAAAENWSLRDETEEDGDSQTSVSRVKATGKTSANVTNVACADPFTSPALSQANPAPPLPPRASMATGLPCAVAAEEDGEDDGVTTSDGGGGQDGARRPRTELEDAGSTVATEGGREEQEEAEEDDFGLFMQAEGEAAWAQGFAASVPRGSVAHGSHRFAAEPPGWAVGSFRQQDEAWTAFPVAPSDGQWWPSSAAADGRDGRAAAPNAVRVFAEAFPSLPGSSSADPCDPGSVPTLTQLLGAGAGQDQGLLDRFHDLNKMIGRTYHRASSASRDLLLKTLQLEQPRTQETRPAPWAANRRLSPGLPSANQHAHSAAAKRRLSYDCNRNIMG